MAMALTRMEGDWKRWTLLGARIALSAVLGFWIWFAGMHLFGNEPGNGMASLWPVLSIVSTCLALGIIAWLWARVGGVLLIAAAVASAWYYHNTATLWLMCAPLATCGVALLLLAPARSAVLR